jgi:hypothetical protein
VESARTIYGGHGGRTTSPSVPAVWACGEAAAPGEDQGVHCMLLPEQSLGAVSFSGTRLCYGVCFQQLSLSLSLSLSLPQKYHAAKTTVQPPPSKALVIPPT